MYHSSIALGTTFPIAPFGYGMMDMATGGSWKSVEEATAEAEAAHPMICAGAVGRDPDEDLSVASRVLRAKDAFGVLDVPLDDGGRPPSDAEVAQAFEAVRDALQHQAGVGLRSGCAVLLTFPTEMILLAAFDGRLERLSEPLAQRLA